MRPAAILAWNSWQENLRSRFFILTAVFGIVLLYISLLLGLLAADQELRVLVDFGLGLIELMGLAAALYGASTMILRELETKTIYLILTRPVRPGQYLLGRFLGLMLSVLVSVLLMSAAHLVILFAKGWRGDPAYAAALAGVFVKIFITAALALFLALFSSSILTALVITTILWTLGHFLPEIRFMIAWGSAKPAMVPLTALSYVIPDLQLYNVRDQLSNPPRVSLAARFLYAAAYSGVWLALSSFLLRRKEF